MELLPGLAGWDVMVGIAISVAVYVYYVVAQVPVGWMRLVGATPAVLIYLLAQAFILDPRDNTVGLIVCTTLLGWWANFKILALCWGTGPLVPSVPAAVQTNGVDVPSPQAKARNATVRHRKGHSTATVQPQHNAPTPAPAAFPLGLFITCLLLPLAFAKPRAHSQGVAAAAESWQRAVVRSLGCLGIFGALILLLDFRPLMSTLAVNLAYVLIMYMFLLFMLDLSAALMKGAFGFVLAPHFNHPYLSSSLADFWGRRWNLVAEGLLRDVIYRPTKLGLLALGVPLSVGHAVGVVAAFAVSGAMHELILFQGIGGDATGGMWLCFFTLHGVAVVLEGGLAKGWKAMGFPHPPRVLAIPVTILLLLWSAEHLFFPPVRINDLDKRAIAEFRSLLFIKDLCGPNCTTIG